MEDMKPRMTHCGSVRRWRWVELNHVELITANLKHTVW
jgi:hypothetical protein